MTLVQQQAASSPPTTLTGLAEWIGHDGGGFVPAATLRALLYQQTPEALADWQRFAASWDELPTDLYMGDGGTYRSRRHATFSAAADGNISLAPHQPHYQALNYNALNGGIARNFEPIATDVAAGATLQSVLRFCLHLFGSIEPHSRWHIETHQFRIRAVAGAEGKPTPEGVHRDGVDFVLVMLVRRINIASGTTTIHDHERRMTGSFTLTEPLDAALLDDRRCYHGVTPVTQLDTRLPAWRDVLVVTFRKVG